MPFVSVPEAADPAPEPGHEAVQRLGGCPPGAPQSAAAGTKKSKPARAAPAASCGHAALTPAAWAVPGHPASGSRRWLLAAAAEINMAASRVGHLQRVAAPRKAEATGRLSGEGVAAYLGQSDDGRAHAVCNENGRGPATQRTRWSGRRLAAGWPVQRQRRWWQGGVSGRSPCAGLPPVAPNDAPVYCGCSCSAEARRHDVHLDLHNIAAKSLRGGHGSKVLRVGRARLPRTPCHRCATLSAAQWPLRAARIAAGGRGGRRDEGDSRRRHRTSVNPTTTLINLNIAQTVGRSQKGCQCVSRSHLF